MTFTASLPLFYGYERKYILYRPTAPCASWKAPDARHTLYRDNQVTSSRKGSGMVKEGGSTTVTAETRGRRDSNTGTEALLRLEPPCSSDDIPFFMRPGCRNFLCGSGVGRSWSFSS